MDNYIRVQRGIEKQIVSIDAKVEGYKVQLSHTSDPVRRMVLESQIDVEQAICKSLRDMWVELGAVCQ